MFNNYIKNLGFLQVNNFTVNVNFDCRCRSSGSSAETEQTKSDSVHKATSVYDYDKSAKVAENKKIDWDLVEDFEENINDFRQKFLPSKLNTLKLENIYLFLKNYQKAENLHYCGSYLEFLIQQGETIDKKKLHRLNSCKQRLCPFCAWRRSLRVFSNVLSCYNAIVSEDCKDSNYKSRFIFITLTTKNVCGNELAGEIDRILKAFSKLTRQKAFKSAFLGCVRAVEVVCDREKYITSTMYFSRKNYYDKQGLYVGSENPNYLMFNVHIHVLAHTQRLLYSKNYITQENLTLMWQKALSVDYSPIVDIRDFKAKSVETKGREIAEIAKYTVKPVDYLRSDFVEWEELKDNLSDDFLTDVEVIRFLDSALSGRRLFAYLGTFKEKYASLKLNESLSDDFVDNSDYYILRYYFDYYLKVYKRF